MKSNRKCVTKGWSTEGLSPELRQILARSILHATGFNGQHSFYQLITKGQSRVTTPSQIPSIVHINFFTRLNTFALVRQKRRCVRNLTDVQVRRWRVRYFREEIEQQYYVSADGDPKNFRRVFNFTVRHQGHFSPGRGISERFWGHSRRRIPLNQLSDVSGCDSSVHASLSLYCEFSLRGKAVRAASLPKGRYYCGATLTMTKWDFSKVSMHFYDRSPTRWFSGVCDKFEHRDSSISRATHYW